MIPEEIVKKHVFLNAYLHSGRAQVGAVIGKVIAEFPEAKQNIKELKEIVEKFVREVNQLSFEEIKRTVEEMGWFTKKEKKDELKLPPLPNAEEGKVVMRLAPFPSGPLHLGNARMVLLNDEYVKMYKGKLILFFDDTIGSEEKPIDPQAYELIRDGLDWLGVKYKEVYYKSDRLEIYYKFAKEMIEKGWAYVCTCSAEEIRENRRYGIECKCRGRSIEENLELWEKMLNGEIEEGGAVVRLKTDMKHPDPAFRDRVLLRICERPHPRVGNKYRVWPMMEFSWAIDDHLLGITHILRGKELMIEDRVEEFIWEKFGWEKSVFVHYGLLKFSGMESKLSKSKNRKLIEMGILKGWDDPRTWSLQSLRKRGIRTKAIRNFVLRMGLSEADVTVPVEILYAENRKIVDPIANRYFAVLNPVQISVNGLEISEIEIKYHPDFPEKGKRKIPVNPQKIFVEKEDFDKLKGQEVGLINLAKIRLEKDSKFIRKEIPYDIPKIHWVSEPHEEITIVMPNGEEKKALADIGVKELKIDDIVQFYRVGFCRLDDKENKIFYFAHK